MWETPTLASAAKDTSDNEKPPMLQEHPVSVSVNHAPVCMGEVKTDDGKTANAVTFFLRGWDSNQPVSVGPRHCLAEKLHP